MVYIVGHFVLCNKMPKSGYSIKKRRCSQAHNFSGYKFNMTPVSWQASLAVTQYDKEGKREILTYRRDQTKVQAWLCKNPLSLEITSSARAALVFLDNGMCPHDLISWY